MSTERSGYRLQASQCQDAMKVVYYVERDLAHFHPTKGACHPCKPVCSQHVSVFVCEKGRLNFHFKVESVKGYVTVVT